jgi:hypothetical protein
VRSEKRLCEAQAGNPAKSKGQAQSEKL